MIICTMPGCQTSAGCQCYKELMTVDPSCRPRNLRAVKGSTRDIYEIANQLGGYVGPNTEKRLAEFLIREAKEAELIADEIVRLRIEIDNHHKKV